MSKAKINNFYRESKVLNSQRKPKQVTLELPPAHAKQYELINAFDFNHGIRFVVGACS